MEDLFDSLDAIEAVEMLQRRNLFARRRLYRERPDYFTQYDKDFFIRFRLSKQNTLILLEKIERHLEYPDNRNLPPIKQLLCTLRFYATGSHLLTMSDFVGISTATCSRIVKKVSEALITLRDEYIIFPESEAEQKFHKAEFYRIARFPNVLGCIDCTHIKIQSPGGDDAELFRNRKSYMSINVQTIAAANLSIMDIVARWPGSTHDSSIYQNSTRYSKFERGDYRGSYLLGDSGYPLKCHLLTPYLNPTSHGQHCYNEAHIKTRNVVERSYGVLKRRFPVLALGLRVKNILACSILHNFCIQRNECEPIDEGVISNLDELIAVGQIPPSPTLITNPIYGFQRSQVTQYFENL